MCLQYAVLVTYTCVPAPLCLYMLADFPAKHVVPHLLLLCFQAGIDGTGQVIGCGDSGVDVYNCLFYDGNAPFTIRLNSYGNQVSRRREGKHDQGSLLQFLVGPFEFRTLWLHCTAPAWSQGRPLS